MHTWIYTHKPKYTLGLKGKLTQTILLVIMYSTSSCTKPVRESLFWIQTIFRYPNSIQNPWYFFLLWKSIVSCLVIKFHFGGNDLFNVKSKTKYASCVFFKSKTELPFVGVIYSFNPQQSSAIFICQICVCFFTPISILGRFPIYSLTKHDPLWCISPIFT